MNTGYTHPQFMMSDMQLAQAFAEALLATARQVTAWNPIPRHASE
ncbi:hypothetical protein UCMB321_3747 [Pseudomonas batumici]|uniref:Uncharacterized protein n=1 Tax=Pseudomonas batumici TaxID=226910 RepID=A0A0C2E9E5_9PSED|nr:hypothetical protein UCMB321_3747 [Pseudomonas batumici]